MMGRMQRDKGKEGEREFARELTWALDCDAHRGRQYCGAPEAPDVKTSIKGVHFEVKRVESLSLYKAMEQAENECGDDIPVVGHRRSRKPWLIVVKLSDLSKLVKLLVANEKEK